MSGALTFFIFFVFLQLAYSPCAWGFKYEISETAILHPSPLQNALLTNIFSEHGFNPVSNRSLALSGFPMDNLLASSDWSQLLALKGGLKAPQEVMGKIIGKPELKVNVFHFIFEETPYVLVAINISQAELRKIVQPWLNSDFSLYGSWFLPAAWGASCSSHSKPDNHSFQSLATHIEDQSALQKIGQCGADALAAIQAPGHNVLNFFRKLKDDPEALWIGMRDSAVAIKDFVLNINNEVKNLYIQLTGLSSEEKAQLACNMIGTFVVGSVAAVAGGFLLAKILPHVLLNIRMATQLLSKLKALENRGVALPNLHLISREIISCVR